MLKGKVIFMLSLMKFDGLESSNFTIAKYLAKNNEVYYIEHPLTFKDYFTIDKNTSGFKIRRYALKFNSNGLLLHKLDGINILLVHPLIPVNFLPKGKIFNFLHSINEKLIARRIKRIITEKKIPEYIFINAYEFHYPGVADYLDPSLKVYYCVDPIPDYHKKHGPYLEKKLAQKSDVIICTSKWLCEQKKQINNNTYFVPNGSDLIKNFSIESLSVHPLVKPIKKPIAGYVGAIERRLDFDLIREVAKNNPSLSFVFVGPASNVPDWFKNTRNIFLLPQVPYNEVPDIIYSFDICIIPFKKDDISKAIFPLKLFEYLSVGKPVIITSFNEDLIDFTMNTVNFVNSPETFTQAINDSLHDHPDKIKQRMEIAAKNSWEGRANSISEIIHQNLNVSIKIKDILHMKY